MNINEYLQLLTDRFSVRKFTSEPVAEQDIEALLCAAQLSPTACNNQPFRLCVVTSQEGLAKVDEATKCRYGAQAVIIGAYDKGASAKGLGYETGDFGDIDTTIVLTNMANAATAAGLGSCWVGAYDPQVIRKNFNVPENYVLVDLLMVGHPAATCEPSPRHTETLSLDTLVVRETF